MHLEVLLLLLSAAVETKLYNVRCRMTGTTQSRVSFFMNRFRRLGFVEYKGRRPVTVSPRGLMLWRKPCASGTWKAMPRKVTAA
jgi:hypothetical protein